MATERQQSDALISVRGLRVVRGRRHEDPFVLEVPALDIPRARFTTIVGESGCGKTTLLMILGLMRGFDADDFAGECEELTFRVARPGHGEGSVQEHHLYRNLGLDGSGMALAAEQRELLRRDLVGFCLQGGELIPSLSLLDNVAVPRMLSRRRQPRQRAMDHLHVLRLEPWIGSLPGQLSGGQKQRGIFARALVHDPPLIILDEPTSALDRVTAESAISILKTQTQQRAQTVVMVTHDRHLAHEFSDYLVTMDVQGARRGGVTRTEWLHSAPVGDAGAAGGAPAAAEAGASCDAGGDGRASPARFDGPGGARCAQETRDPRETPDVITHARLGLMDALGPIYGLLAEDVPRRRPAFLSRMRRSKDHGFLLQSARSALVIVAIGLFMLLLRGMRSGLIEDFKQDLTRSPTARELVVTPLVTTGSLTEDALKELVEKHPAIEIVIPSTTHVAFPTPQSERNQGITLVGTLGDDPALAVLFEDQDFSGFDANAVVLPQSVAEELQARIGASVTLWVTRVTDAEGVDKEVQPAVLTVTNLLPEGRGRTAYVHLDFAADVEDFKAGRPVESRGWLGRPQPIAPRYAAFLLFAKSRLSGRETTALASRGLTVERLSAGDPAASLHGGLLTADTLQARGMSAPLVYKVLSGRQEGDLRWLQEAIWSVESLLTDCDGIMMPWNDPLDTVLDGQPVTLVGLSGHARWLRRYLHPDGAIFSKREQAWLIAHRGDQATAHRGRLDIDAGGGRLRLPVQVLGRSLSDGAAGSAGGDPRPVVTAPASLIAHLIMAGMGVAEPDTTLGIFRSVSATREYYRARVFVRDVYQVVGTHDELARDFAVRSEHARVREVQRYRTVLDYLVNVLSVIAVVIAFAIVWIVFHDVSERKKRMIGTLRIMGLSRGGVVVLLLTQGILVAVIAILLLAALGAGASLLLNLIVGSGASSVTPSDFFGVVIAIVGVCLLGTYLPARAASLVDPAVALEQAEQQR